MGICIEGFKSFFKIGLFTLGGGYAMIPLIERTIVEERRWMGRDEFMDILSLAQALPGVFAINFSIYLGRKLRGVPGALCFALGTALPSFLIILLIAMCMQNYREWPVVEAVFKGVRPAVVALIAAPCISLGRAARINANNLWLPVTAALLVWLGGVSPVYVIVMVALGGYLYGRINRNDEEGGDA